MEKGDWSGAKVSNITCVKKDERVFTCMGNYEATRSSVARQGLSTVGWTEEDFKAMSSQASWEVTVDESGSWIAEPQ